MGPGLLRQRRALCRQSFDFTRRLLFRLAVAGIGWRQLQNPLVVGNGEIIRVFIDIERRTTDEWRDGVGRDPDRSGVVLDC